MYELYTFVCNLNVLCHSYVSIITFVDSYESWIIFFCRLKFRIQLIGRKNKFTLTYKIIINTFLDTSWKYVSHQSSIISPGV